MRGARLLRTARRRARLSQRALAARAGVPQSTIARIESGAMDPTLGNLIRILAACGAELELAPLLGAGVDVTQIERRLRLEPGDRIREAERAAESLPAVRRARPVR